MALMGFGRWLSAALALVVSLGLSACERSTHREATFESRLPEEQFATTEQPFEPIPQALDLDPQLVEIGRQMFSDPLLSGDGTRRCTDCHDLSAGGIVPGEARSNHPRNATGPYNVPTVFNVAFNFRYNWNGKFGTLEEHVSGPMMSASVMAAGSWSALVRRLRAKYDDAFVRAGYEGGVSETGVRKALSAYQRSLITPNSRFDRFLRHEIELNDDERAGLELFKSIGCATCHQGINVGGNLFQRFGVMQDAFGGRQLEPGDYGRMLVTGKKEDAHVFRVPSLRNVALTAPYFHDGSAPTLADAVRHMGRVQLDYILTESEVRRIVAFLHTLTGELNGAPLAGGVR